MQCYLKVVGVLALWGSGLALQSNAPISEKRIALTFDDVPFTKPMGYWRPREISNLILRTLQKSDIKAAGFVVQEKVEEDPSTYVILNDWVTRGHLLGNQTWGDVDLNQLSHRDFMEHAIDGQEYLRRLARAHPFNYRYLRFPQLHQGNEKKKHQRVKRALDRGRYQVAPVTIKTATHAFNAAFIESERDEERLSRLKSIYLQHVQKSLRYGESQSQRVFGRNIAHIVQLQIGIAAASFLPDLVGWLQEEGYSFVSFPEALEDPAYRTEESYVGPLGLTFTDRVAATQGLFYDVEAGTITRLQVEQLMDATIR